MAIYSMVSNLLKNVKDPELGLYQRMYTVDGFELAETHTGAKAIKLRIGPLQNPEAEGALEANRLMYQTRRAPPYTSSAQWDAGILARRRTIFGERGMQSQSPWNVSYLKPGELKLHRDVLEKYVGDVADMTVEDLDRCDAMYLTSHRFEIAAKFFTEEGETWGQGTAKFDEWFNSEFVGEPGKYVPFGIPGVRGNVGPDLTYDILHDVMAPMNDKTLQKYVEADSMTLCDLQDLLDSRRWRSYINEEGFMADDVAFEREFAERIHNMCYAADQNELAEMGEIQRASLTPNVFQMYRLQDTGKLTPDELTNLARQMGFSQEEFAAKFQEWTGSQRYLRGELRMSTTELTAIRSFGKQVDRLSAMATSVRLETEEAIQNGEIVVVNSRAAVFEPDLLEMSEMSRLDDSEAEDFFPKVVNFAVSAGNLTLRGLATVGRFVIGPGGQVVRGIAAMVSAVNWMGKIKAITDSWDWGTEPVVATQNPDGTYVPMITTNGASSTTLGDDELLSARATWILAESLRSWTEKSLSNLYCKVRNSPTILMKDKNSQTSAKMEYNADDMPTWTLSLAGDMVMRITKEDDYKILLL
jgi:hypothetical protein